MIEPLTLERFRICEFYAELLHCSNMSLLNRGASGGPVYDSVGRLTGGLAAMEELARVIAISTGDESQRDDRTEEEEEDMSESREGLPVTASVSSSITDASSLLSDSEGDLSDASDGSLDDFPVSAPRPPSTTPSPLDSPFQRSPVIVPSSPITSIRRGALTPVLSSSPSGYNSRRTSRSRSRASSSAKRRRETDREIVPIGDLVKQRFIELNVISTVVVSNVSFLPTCPRSHSLQELFFKFPWNNFLHNVVYDFLHQVLTGRVDKGLNRDLAIALFRDAQIVTQIVEGQRRNDEASDKPKGVRLGYMGHLTLIAEDVLSALEHYPYDLLTIVRQYVPQPDWDDYVSTRYKETKRKDTSLLGGGKPVIAPGATRGNQRWKVDEEDDGATLKGDTKRPNVSRGSGSSGASAMEDVSAPTGPPPPPQVS